ncbi:uncharacterized protein HRG_11112 [Hirsutella rhossiliensis]|uniref:Uncharacterized protein n=1 Tax=Hirsutella rhossiliensis TaxID=111463 RepID=A0A9P8MP91_9HYPO|nr:uncharacterized protein HRG_11112 [Hirsutella rhossiliensis]KAH0958019.1 hypothetical protein HRG_11112 [Hirsutella rhossiliensis]
MASLSPSCPPLVGNSDLYGLGVRIGLYSQWIATLLTTVLDSADEGDLRLLNLIVQTAIFLGLCTESSRRASAVGALITQILLCGSLSSVTGDGITYFGHASGFLRVLFYTALSAYGIWFWFAGLPLMLRPGCDDVAVAFFGPTTITGWFRSLGKALSVAGLVVCVALVAFSVHSSLRRFRRGLRAGFARPSGRRPQVEIVLMLLSMGLLGLSIATVEYLIRANAIQGVGVDQIGSVAQLIPLLAGVLACFLSLWRVLTHGLLFRTRCWFFLGWHLR